MKMINNNEFIEVFEKRLSEFTKAPYVVLTDSCTNAIFLSLKYLQVKNQIINIPKQTYISVPQTIIHTGNTINFIDYQWLCNYELGKTGIYDCAVGFKPDMYEPGTFQCTSFQQKKTLKIGKGGAILLDDYEAYKILKRMAWDGRDSSIPVSEDKGLILGYHMNMIPDDAARGILLLNQLDNNDIITKGSDNYPDISEYSCFKEYMS